MVRNSNTTKKDVEFYNEQITGIVDWAVVHKPRTVYGKDGSTKVDDMEYSLSIRMDDENTYKQYTDIIKKHGISELVFNPKTRKDVPRVRQNKEGQLELRVKRAAGNREGVLVELPVVDRNAQPIPKDTLIGNGSKAIVKLLIKHDLSEDTHTIRLQGLQVLKLEKPSGVKFDVVPDDDLDEGNATTTMTKAAQDIF